MVPRFTLRGGTNVETGFDRVSAPLADRWSKDPA